MHKIQPAKHDQVWTAAEAAYEMEAVAPAGIETDEEIFLQEIEPWRSELSLAEDEELAEPFPPEAGEDVGEEPLQLVGAEPSEVAEPPKEGPELASTDEAQSALDRYLREMAEVPVLRPQEEFERARHIAELEISTWECILGYPAVVERVLSVVERVLGRTTPECERLRKIAAKLRGSRKDPGKELASTVARASRELRRIDLDKLAMHEVIAELEVLARGRTGFAAPTAALVSHLRTVKQAYRRAQNAKNEFVKANLRLVVAVARRYRHSAMPFSDVIQEGNIGLMKAVDRYDHGLGYRFSTYASWWIRHAIRRALTDKGHVVRLPVHLVDSQQRIARTRRELASRLGREPTAEEISSATGIATKKLDLVRQVPAMRAVSLDQPLGDEDDDRKFLDLVRDPQGEESSVADTLAHQAMLREVLSQLRRLKPVEADVLRQRFGLDDDEERTLNEIGKRYNLSRERIRQIQEQALTKLRTALKRQGLA